MACSGRMASVVMSGTSFKGVSGCVSGHESIAAMPVYESEKRSWRNTSTGQAVQCTVTSRALYSGCFLILVEEVTVVPSFF